MRNYYSGPSSDEVAPFSIDSDVVRHGFSRDMVEKVMEPLREDQRGCPWLLWETELYSQGDLLRAFAHWPRFLPIPAVADHGVGAWPIYAPNEIAAAPLPFLATSAIKFHLLETPEALDVRLIPSPWIEWLRRTNTTISEDASGTIVFVPHSLDGDRLDEHFVDEYVDSITSLAEDFHPVVFSVHQHDVRAGLADGLLERGVPVVSAGDSGHPLFFARWVTIARHFRYATSSVPGSDLPLFHAMGGTYFIHGPSPRWTVGLLASDPSTRSASPFHAVLRDAHSSAIRTLFGGPERERTPSQSAYLRLFSDSGERLTGWQVHMLFWRSLAKVPGSYWSRWRKHVIRRWTRTVRAFGSNALKSVGLASPRIG